MTADTQEAHAGGDKPAGYYAQGRAELVDRLPTPLGRVLDIGCGEGGAAASLRAAGADWISGVELHAPAAERASLVYDEVVTGRAEESLTRVSGRFDTILLYDVLEHLVDPAALLRELHTVVVPGGRAHVSVPNARHWTLLRDLLVRGTFGYTDAGHRDATHLRWFTRSDLVSLLEGSGWQVDRVGHGPVRRVSALAGRVSGGLTTELLVYQWWSLAHAPGNGQAGGR